MPNWSSSINIGRISRGTTSRAPFGNTMVENAASAPPPAPPASGSALGARVAAALVMIPVALAVVWYGGPWIAGLTALAAAVMAWEWGRLVGRSAGLADGL